MLPPDEYRSARRQEAGERGIWQRRFREHTIRSPADYDVHFHYIHYNPVKHGWVRHAIDWPHSSFHRYVQSSVHDPAWAADALIQVLDHE